MLEPVDAEPHHLAIELAKYRLLKTSTLVKPSNNVALLNSIQWIASFNEKSRVVPLKLQRSTKEVSKVIYCIIFYFCVEQWQLQKHRDPIFPFWTIFRSATMKAIQFGLKVHHVMAYILSVVAWWRCILWVTKYINLDLVKRYAQKFTPNLTKWNTFYIFLYCVFAFSLGKGPWCVTM